MNLDESRVYDTSNLNKKQAKKLYKWLRKNSPFFWKDTHFTFKTLKFKDYKLVAQYQKKILVDEKEFLGWDFQKVKEGTTFFDVRVHYEEEILTEQKIIDLGFRSGFSSNPETFPASKCFTSLKRLLQIYQPDETKLDFIVMIHDQQVKLKFVSDLKNLISLIDVSNQF